MPQTNETPPDKGGVSRDLLGSLSRVSCSLDAYLAQFLTLNFSVHPKMAIMLAALTFGGNGNA